MFPPNMIAAAEKLIAACRAEGIRLATAESCTGGLVAACLTEVPGSSDVVDRGFVTYSNSAKHELLGVPEHLFGSVGAVSREVAIAMAEGALLRARTGITVSCTGIAGPGGATPDKPVGLVHIACAVRGRETLHRRCEFGAVGRSNVRLQTVAAALELVQTGLDAFAN